MSPNLGLSFLRAVNILPKPGRALIRLALPFLLLVASCKNEPEWKQNEFKKHEIGKAPADVKLPEVLWNKIEAVYTGVEAPSPKAGEAREGAEGGSQEGAKRKGEEQPASKQEGKKPAKAEEKSAEKASGGEGGGGEGDGLAIDKGALPSEFAPLKVYLIEKNHGILHGQNAELLFAPGGGELDLEDFVEAKKGSFRLVFEFMPEIATSTSGKGDPDRKVFFLSNGVKRKIDGESVGNGCNTYFDISLAVQKATAGSGFTLNTTDQRHISALAGTYFFAVKGEHKLYLAELTIKDSKYPALLCHR